MIEVSQQGIADALSISRATVSRCFTNHPAINPKTRAKVFQLAAKIGYQHQESRSNSTKKNQHKMNICALVCTEKEEFIESGEGSPGEQILEGVTEQALLHNANVEVHFIPPDAEDLSHPKFKQTPNLTKGKSNGVLLIYPFADAIIKELSPLVPLVSLVDQLETNAIDCIDVDHYNGIGTVIDHLVSLGHRRIGFYTRDYAVEAGWSYRRYSAYIEKMARMRLPVAHTDIIGMFPRSKKTVEQSIDEVADRTRQGVSAWVCAADHQAYDLIQGLSTRGLNVPKDVSVTGFDGINGENLPSLTTINIPFREIGMSGTNRLAARTRKRYHECRHIYITGSLRKGETTAKCNFIYH